PRTTPGPAYFHRSHCVRSGDALTSRVAAFFSNHPYEVRSMPHKTPRPFRARTVAKSTAPKRTDTVKQAGVTALVAIVGCLFSVRVRGLLAALKNRTTPPPITAEPPPVPVVAPDLTPPAPTALPAPVEAPKLSQPDAALVARIFGPGELAVDLVPEPTPEPET